MIFVFALQVFLASCNSISRVDGWWRISDDGDFLRQIHLAIHNRHLIKFCLEKYHNVNVLDHYGRSPLMLAILTSARIRELKVLISFGADVNGLWTTHSPYGKISPLGVAVRFKDLELVKFLLENDADPNLKLYEGNTALHLAVICEELDIVDVLLEAKADPHVKNEYGYTPLHLAALGSKNLLKRVLKSSDTYVHCGHDGETPLHLAAHANNLENVKILVNKLGHVNFEMRDHLTPYDCSPKHSRVRQFLSDLDVAQSLRHGKSNWVPFANYFPEPLVKLMEAIKPILLSVLLEEDTIVKELLPKEKTSTADSHTVPTSEFCPPVKTDPQWYWVPYVSDFPNPCIMRITAGFSLPSLTADYVRTTYDSVFKKLENGEIIEEKDYFPCFMLVVRCWGAFANAYEALALGGTCLKMLKNVGVDVDGTDETGYKTPLYVALDEGYEALAMWLINNGANPHKMIAGKTPLMMATARGLKDVVALLIEKGVDVDVADRLGATALHIAAYYSLYSPPEIIKSLTAAGAKVNAKGPSDVTPLHLSALSMSPDRCQLLLNAGAYIDLKVFGLRPVDLAFLFMNIAAAAILKLAGSMFKSAIKHDIKDMERHLVRGANVNCQRSDYGTPLITLSRPNYTFHTILLLKYDPEYKVTDKHGLTAFHHAVRNKNYCTLTMYLKKWGIDMLFEPDNPHHIDNLIRIAQKSTKNDSVMPGETEYVLRSWKACYEQFGPERLERLINKQFYDYIGFATVLLKHGWNNAKAYFEGRVCEKEKPKV